MLNLREVIKKYPECLDSAAKFRSYLLDLYPDPADRARIKVLADVLSCGVVDEIKKGNSDAVSLARYNKIIEEKYGYSPRLIKESVFRWTEALRIDQHPCPEDTRHIDEDEKSFDTGKENHIHAFTDIVVPSTCRERGYTLHQCSCGYSHKDSYTTLGDHSFELVDLIPSTCVEEGREDYLCSVCGEYQSNPIPKKSHDYGDWVITKATTCNYDGIRERKCHNCAHTETERIPALMHNWGDWMIQEYASCTEDGKKVRRCDRCSMIDERRIPATGHDFSDWEISKDYQGKEERFCKNCGTQEFDIAGKHINEAKIAELEQQLRELNENRRRIKGKDVLQLFMAIFSAVLVIVGIWVLTEGLSLLISLFTIAMFSFVLAAMFMSLKELWNEIKRNKSLSKKLRKEIESLKKQYG